MMTAEGRLSVQVRTLVAPIGGVVPAGDPPCERCSPARGYTPREIKPPQ
jgi:hypothetical protein